MEKLLTQLLQHDDNRLRIFDMGRRISKLPIDTFTRVEQNRIPYPLPFLHHAWVGLLLWNPSAKDQNLIWFLKLPLCLPDPSDITSGSLKNTLHLQLDGTNTKLS